MKKPLRGRPVAPPEERRVALGDGPGAGPVAHPQPPGQLPVAAAGQRDEALGVLGEERLAEARHALRAGHVGPRHEPAQAPPADLRAGEQDEVRAADPLADPAQVLLDRLAMAGQPGAGRAGPDAAGPRSRSAGSGLAGSGAPAAARPAAGGRGMTIPSGSATAGSSSSISSPTTGWSPAASAALTNRTAPYRPSWSVTASPVSPSSTARSTRSSGADAPSRNEKLVWQWSSAYGVGATGRSGRKPADWGLVSIERMFCLDQSGPARRPGRNSHRPRAANHETQTGIAASHRHARTDAPDRLLRRPDRGAGRPRDAADPRPPARDPRGPGGRHVDEHTTSRRLGARDDPAALDCDGRAADPPDEPVSGAPATGPRRLGVTAVPVAWG